MFIYVFLRIFFFEFFLFVFFFYFFFIFIFATKIIEYSLSFRVVYKTIKYWKKNRKKNRIVY